MQLQGELAGPAVPICVPVSCCWIPYIPRRGGGGKCICSYTPLYSPACLNNSSITRTPFSRTSGYKTKHNGTQVLFTTTSYSASVLQFFYKSFYSTVLYVHCRLYNQYLPTLCSCTTNSYFSAFLLNVLYCSILVLQTKPTAGTCTCSWLRTVRTVRSARICLTI